MELIERYSYGWCHGPAGDAQTFRLLHSITGDPAWSQLADRCWQTVTHCGLPERLRPGFWDNNGRCCGTAGVLALACDRATHACAVRGTRRMPCRGPIIPLRPLRLASIFEEEPGLMSSNRGGGIRISCHEASPRTGEARVTG